MQSLEVEINSVESGDDSNAKMTMEMVARNEAAAAAGSKRWRKFEEIWE